MRGSSARPAALSGAALRGSIVWNIRRKPDEDKMAA
jgi:hypothetical protein